jgi:HAD superfamily hydrolase (TIGR01549 family)
MIRAVRGVVLWDFDGTLAWRPGLWGGCMLETLDELAPGHGAQLDGVRAALKGGFPWDRHDEPHPELSNPDAWWHAITPVLSRALEGAVAEAQVPELLHAFRLRFTDASRGWRVFDDSAEALGATAAAGWRNVVLSNHVPELAALVEHLGLGGLVERVFSSAATGYEKPHPEAFRLALRACGDPAGAWMVGDNPTADVAGAEAIGIPAILVRTNGTARRTARDVATAARLIVGAEASEPRCAQATAKRTRPTKEER